jgi:monothiol glutaredoxin
MGRPVRIGTVQPIVIRHYLAPLEAKESIAKDPGCATLRAHLKLMNKPKIVAYLKPTCGWSQGVRAVLRQYDLPYEDRDIINDPAQRQEMIERSGQMLSPCVEVNGHMLADVSGEEVEAYLLANNLVTPTSRVPDAPTNQPCAHEVPQAAALQFRR